VIGAGHLGRFHAQKYRSIPEAELAGVMDINKERAEKVAGENGCLAYTDLNGLLKEVDAVSVVVPTDLHRSVGEQVLDAGKHCLMEKPIAQSIEEADRLIRKAEQKELLLQVGHIERFNPALRSLEEFHLDPRFIESHRLSEFNPRGTEVAVVLDLMIHDIDAILSIVNSRVVHIDASGVAVVSDTVDIANARIRFRNGCVANLTASRISQKKMRKMRLFQKDTYVAVDFLERLSEVYTLSEGEGPGMVVGEMGVGDRKKVVRFFRPPVPEDDGLMAELRTFVHSVRSGNREGVGGKEAREALSVAMKILKTMEG
jgi:predicted dehydrogenase